MTGEHNKKYVVPQELLDNPNLLFIGQIVGVHGLKGGLRVKCSEGNLDKFLRVSTVIPGLKTALPPIAVIKAIAVKNSLVLFLEGIESREASEPLIHNYLFGKRTEITELEGDEWWVRDLIGLDVYTTEGEMIGTICDIMSTGSEILEVRSIDKTKKDTFLIPFVKEIVPNVRMDLRRVEVKVIPGLLDL